MKKLRRIGQLQITAFRQVLSPNFIISIIFSMQIDFNSPTFLPPNFLQSSKYIRISLFAKIFTTKVFYCTVDSYSWLLNSDIIHIIYLNCIYTWRTIAGLIMSWLYSCVVFINYKFKDHCDCSVRVY